MYILRPARAAAAAHISLIRSRADVTSARRRHYGGPMRPGIAGLRVILGVAESY